MVNIYIYKYEKIYNIIHIHIINNIYIYKQPDISKSIYRLLQGGFCSSFGLLFHCDYHGRLIRIVSHVIGLFL